MLDVQDLSVAWQGKQVVHHVSFHLPKGGVLAIVGESGSGKSTILKALLGLPGVLFVHIHAHDGETTVDYSPAKTKLMDILGVLQARNLEAAL